LVVTTTTGTTTERIPLNTSSNIVELEYPSAVTKVEVVTSSLVTNSPSPPGSRSGS